MPTNPLAVFRFHGVNLETGQTQAKGDCPFCGKESHFYVNAKDGRWDCKSCLESGNVSSFLSKLHAFSLKETASTDYEELAEQRHLHPNPQAFKVLG
jgi:DNA primase